MQTSLGSLREGGRTYVENVENGLAESHDDRNESIDRRNRKGRRSRLDMDEVNVEEVENALSHVHQRLSGRKAVLRIPARKTIDIIYIHVKRVWRPDPMQVTAEHAPWSQEDVPDIPSNHEAAKKEPGRNERTWSVHGCLHGRRFRGSHDNGGVDGAIDGANSMVNGGAR